MSHSALYFGCQSGPWSSQAALKAAWKARASGASARLWSANQGVKSPPPPNQLCVGGDEAGVHVPGGHAGIERMSDDADAGGEKARVFGGARHGLGHFRREGPVHHRNVDAHLFEHPAAHQAHGPAAALVALPRLQFETAGVSGVEVGGSVVLDGFKGGDELALKLAEPGLGRLLLVGEVLAGHRVCKSQQRPCRNALRPVVLRDREQVAASIVFDDLVNSGPWSPCFHPFAARELCAAGRAGRLICDRSFPPYASA